MCALTLAEEEYTVTDALLLTFSQTNIHPWSQTWAQCVSCTTACIGKRLVFCAACWLSFLYENNKYELVHYAFLSFLFCKCLCSTLLLKQCVWSGCTAAPVCSQTAAMRVCIPVISTLLPSRRPCWLLGPVWLHYMTPTDMVRLALVSFPLSHITARFDLFFILKGPQMDRNISSPITYENKYSQICLKSSA